MKLTCEFCGRSIGTANHYSLSDCNETGRGVTLHRDCVSRLRCLADATGHRPSNLLAHLAQGPIPAPFRYKGARIQICRRDNAPTFFAKVIAGRWCELGRFTRDSGSLQATIDAARALAPEVVREARQRDKELAPPGVSGRVAWMALHRDGDCTPRGPRS